MAPIWAWARLDVRRRWRSLVVLSLLTMVSGAVVLTAAAGAHRGGTAADRLRAVTLPADVIIVPNELDFDYSEIAKLPYVEALARLAITDAIVPVGDSDPEVVGYPTLDDQLLRTIEKPVVLAGRVYDPTKVDEVVVTPEFVRRYAKGVGDSLTMALAAPNQIYDEAEPADELNGPRVPVVIVGVIRTPDNLDLPGRPGLLLVSPALTMAYTENIIGPADRVSDQTVVNAQARLSHGAADIPQLRRDLQRLTGRGVDIVDLEATDHIGRHTSAFESACLAVLAGIALLAALFLVGQALARHVAYSAAELATARALGMAPRQVVVGATTAPVLAVVAGLLAAVAASIIASQSFPIGLAGAVEPDPGIDVDVPVLGGGALLILALLILVATVTALAALRTSTAKGPPRRSAVANLVGGSRLPVPVVIGTRFALEAGRGATAVPARPALLGAVIGVIGVVGVIAFDSGITDALDHPERVGQTAQVLSVHGYGAFDFDPKGTVLRTVRSLDYVEQVLDSQLQVASDPDGSTSVSLFSHEDDFPAVVLSGRMPETADEVTLAPKSLDALRADVGDTVTLKGSRESRALTVVGEALVPEPSVIDTYSDGGWITHESYDQMFSGDSGFQILLIRVEPAARTADVSDRILRDVDKTLPEVVDQGLTFDPPDVADAQATLERTRTLPRGLGLFLALLACGALGHALTLAIRRRSGEIAIFRALGMTPSQSRVVVATQATTTMLVGIAFGIPLGLAFGRTLWRAVAAYTPLDYVPPTAVGSLILVGAAGLLVANLLAALPARRAARIRVSTVLRAE